MSTAKNLGLLSFGDEAENDEAEFSKMNKKLKGKSAHDVLQDETLSKELAVRPEELSTYDRSDDIQSEEQKEERLSRVRAKLSRKLRKGDALNGDVKVPDDDLHNVLEEARTAEEQAKIEGIAAETHALVKEYKRALRKPKEKVEVEEEEPQSEALKEYHDTRLKFKNKSKGIVRYRDPRREEQTLTLLQKLQTNLAHSSKAVHVFDKSAAGIGEQFLPKMSNPELDPENMKRKLEKEKSPERDEKKKKIAEEEVTTEEERQAQEQLQKEAAAKMDLDADDIEEPDWMVHTFVAPADDPNVTKAKDANMKEFSEDWYDITDPRNKMSIRRREDAEHVGE
uniref:Hepatocellular carcinoma-associated antigen 59-domain-containing protein n=1 Tax=Steinernema glaseri TaxID=37863 RepID=A0A1I7YRU3_9BILA